MTKTQAADLFGGTDAALARALNRTKSAISQWNEKLTEDRINMIIGAAVRNKITIPPAYLK